MADFGALTLPDHDLTANEFKELARRVGRAAFVPLFVRFYERVITSEATIEEQRRALSDIARWVGVEEDKKVDPNANLPVFNIVFGAPSAHGATSMQVVDVTPPPPAIEQPPALEPEELAIIENLVRFPHGPTEEAKAKRDAASPAPDSGALHAGAPGERRDNGHEGERPQALQRAHGAPDQDQDGAPAERQADDAAFEEALMSLDEALGL